MSNERSREKETVSVELEPRLARSVFRIYTQELSLISDYIYYNILLDGVYDSLPGSEYVHSLSETFEQFALDSMRHFKILGSLAFALGCNPALNTRVTNTPYNLSDDLGSRAPVVCQRMIRNSVKAEKDLTREYHTLCLATSDQQIKRILNAILSDKDKHISVLEQFDTTQRVE